MKLHIEIDCDNAAFDEDRAAEVARILTELAPRITSWSLLGGMPIRDASGNCVGRAWTTGVQVDD